MSRGPNWGSKSRGANIKNPLAVLYERNRNLENAVKDLLEFVEDAAVEFGRTPNEMHDKYEAYKELIKLNNCTK